VFRTWKINWKLLLRWARTSSWITVKTFYVSKEYFKESLSALKWEGYIWITECSKPCNLLSGCRLFRKHKPNLNLFRIIGPTERNIVKELILAESQTTFWTTDRMGKKPRKTVKKMEWNRNRPLGLILDDEEEDKPYFHILASPFEVSKKFKKLIIGLLSSKENFERVSSGILRTPSPSKQFPSVSQTCNYTYSAVLTYLYLCKYSEK
jgi:hypothetical protein